MILVHAQKMYKIFRLLIEVPDYSTKNIKGQEKEVLE